MMRSRTTAQVQADLSALHAAAERAGRALGCVFSSYEEFEASLRGGPAQAPSRAVPLVATVLLATAFLFM